MNSSILGHVQKIFLSPYTLSTLATGGQNLFIFKNFAGYAASSLEYLWSQLSDANSRSVCGAFLMGLSTLSNSPDLILSISDYIFI